ncbi:DUF3182 family protein [Novosphingobium sp.]|jgi:hypothetical protein|uniref:DUF3182 family protein n=1 Tax=Novosphingobium sp. TaxID=1874826 RepID=UPI002FE1FCC6
MTGQIAIRPVSVCQDSGSRNRHDRESRAELTRRLATLCDGGVTGVTGEDGMHGAGNFFVPDDTMLVRQATEMGIFGEEQLFGGVVPERFMATKIVSHGLPFEDSPAPACWNRGLAADLKDTVLRGFSVFSSTDAQSAGRLLLEQGPIRLKDVDATSGQGQTVVEDGAALDAAIAAIDPEVLQRSGLVIEENLVDVKTYSAGVVRLFGRSIAYWGTQQLTLGNDGEEVYGGSRLHVVRGGWNELEASGLTGELAEVVVKARRYDRACFAAYPRMFSSRRNYDVATGRDARGRMRIGVLEQSWRAGGASGAEIAAFEAFAADPSRTGVEAATVEVHGVVGAAPPGAAVYFSGIDPVVGPMSKYTVVE